MIIIPGTTPTIPFKTNVDLTGMEVILTIAQREKSFDFYPTVINGNKFEVALTQEDTLEFDHRYTALMQYRAMQNGKTVIKSSIAILPIGRALSRKVM